MPALPEPGWWLQVTLLCPWVTDGGVFEPTTLMKCLSCTLSSSVIHYCLSPPLEGKLREGRSQQQLRTKGSLNACNSSLNKVCGLNEWLINFHLDLTGNCH